MADHRDIIVIGASAGGVEAISRLAATLPRELPAAVFVTMHFPRNSTSVLPRILNRMGELEAVHPEDGEAIRHGRIYVAPPDWHLMVMHGHVHLVRGPTENGNRPAVDPMFRSAALAYRSRVIGVVLSGNLDDGTAGLYAIQRRGGVGVAQDPEEALFPSMPRSAIDNGVARHVATLRDMGGLLQQLVREEITADAEATVPDDAGRETALSRFDAQAIGEEAGHPGEPSPYSCPDCGGVLWGLAEEQGMPRFRCRVGHGWTQEGLLMQQTETLDAALWTALRTLEEHASLNRRMAERARARGNPELSERFSGNAHTSERKAQVIREALLAERKADVERDETRFPPAPDAAD